MSVSYVPGKGLAQCNHEQVFITCLKLAILLEVYLQQPNMCLWDSDSAYFARSVLNNPHQMSNRLIAGS